MGFHGKLPSHGDFVRRRVTGEFLGVWDAWLGQCLHHTRRALGDAWLDAYLTSPIWRFALSARVCGAAPSTGVLMPSVDAVGRYYPLTLVRSLPAGSCLPALAVEEHQWFTSLEELALSVLETHEAFDLQVFDEAVLALGEQLLPRVAGDSAAVVTVPRGATRFCLQGLEDLGPAVLLVQQVMQTGDQGFSLWWTEGSDRIAPCLFVHPHLPPPERFPAMIDGEWAQHGWDSRSLHWDTSQAVAVNAQTPKPLRFRSAAVSDAGKVREINEDAWLDRPDQGLWAVADGVGGSAAGDVASRNVVDGLQGIPVGGDLQERLNAAREVLQIVNGRLSAAARRREGAVDSASTVVALLAGAHECCWLWAGDSRLYRLRGGALERCTRDHSMVEELLDSGALDERAAASHPQANVITRAVGAAGDLALESRFSDLQPGDRFLLCSDGVHGCLEESAMRQAMSGDSPQACVDALLAQVLRGAAADNATAVVVFVD